MVFVVALRIVGDMLTKVDSTRRGAGDGQVIGGLLVVIGVGWLLHRAGVTEVGLRTVLSAMLVTLGVGLVLTARHSGAGLVVLGVVLTMVLAASSSAPTLDWNRGLPLNRNFHGATQRTVSPIRLNEGTPLIERQTAGTLLIDLRQVEHYTGRRSVDAGLTGGDLTIRLPATMKVSVDARAVGGEVRVLDRSAVGGFRAHELFTEEGYESAEQQLKIVARVTGGTVTITRDEAE